MRLKTLVFLTFPFLILYGAFQRVQAQDVTRYLQPGGGLTPEAQRLLRQSPGFNALTPEEVERGRIELERQKKEGEQEALAEKKQEEEERKVIQDISNQEKELRYIANKYKGRAIRNINSVIQGFVENQLIKQNVMQDVGRGGPGLIKKGIAKLDLKLMERDLQTLDLNLVDIMDQYQEDVIHDMVNRFELASVSARDPAKKLRDIFSANKREAVEKIKDMVTAAWRAETELVQETTEIATTDTLERIIQTS